MHAGLQVWGLEKGFCQRTLMCHSSCNSVAITQDGAMVVSGHFDGKLRFWDLRSARATPSCEVVGLHSGQITSVAAGLAGGALRPLEFWACRGGEGLSVHAS